MNRLYGSVSLRLLWLSIGCSCGGCCGNAQPAYPVGTYPIPGNPAQTYPYAGYPAGYPTGAVPPGYPAAPGAPMGYSPAVNGQPTGTLPTYSTPVPQGYPQGYPQGGAYTMGGYPAGVVPPNPGVPLNSYAPSQPYVGR